MSIRTAVIWTVIAVLVGLSYGIAMHYAHAQSFPGLTQEPEYSTNPPEIRKWFRDLTNRMGGSCCGEGDAYPAVIIKMPSANDEQGRESYKPDGEVCVTDPKGKEIVIQGVTIKQTRDVKGPLCQPFSWMKMTREQYGNPMDHAIVFLALDMDGSIRNIYCVVPLPTIY